MLASTLLRFCPATLIAPVCCWSCAHCGHWANVRVKPSVRAQAETRSVQTKARRKVLGKYFMTSLHGEQSERALKGSAPSIRVRGQRQHALRGDKEHAGELKSFRGAGRVIPLL